MGPDIGGNEWITITKRGVGELHIILQVLSTAAGEQSNALAVFVSPSTFYRFEVPG